jgi:hypothetical protein
MRTLDDRIVIIDYSPEDRPWSSWPAEAVIYATYYNVGVVRDPDLGVREHTAPVTNDRYSFRAAAVRARGVHAAFARTPPGPLPEATQPGSSQMQHEPDWAWQMRRTTKIVIRVHRGEIYEPDVRVADEFAISLRSRANEVDVTLSTMRTQDVCLCREHQTLL